MSVSCSLVSFCEREGNDTQPLMRGSEITLQRHYSCYISFFLSFFEHFSDQQDFSLSLSLSFSLSLSHTHTHTHTHTHVHIQSERKREKDRGKTRRDIHKHTDTQNTERKRIRE